MATHFQSLSIRRIVRETADAVTLYLDIPEHLKNNFTFLQGQNITFRVSLNGEEIRRSYSICKAPYENELAVTVKKIPHGKFSTWANESIQIGTQIDAMIPSGSFHVPLQPKASKNYAAFAAGSGITPIISIIKQTLHDEPNSSFTLVYNNKYRNSIIFFEELEALKNRYLERFQLIHLLSQERTESLLNHGRINAEKLEVLSKLIHYSMLDDCFICGPESMIFTVRDFLVEKGLRESQIHFELFTSTSSHHHEDATQSAGTDGMATVQITVDGRTSSFQLGYRDGSILDAALKTGADLPYACKGGMCCTCKAKLLEGNVHMPVHWGLENEEIEKGFILTCQAHPVTEKVVIDFDLR